MCIRDRYDGETNVVKAVVGDVSYQCERFCQLVDVKTAEPLFVYGEDFYAGTPAMTVNEFGKGKAYYICADAEQKFFDNVYEEIVTKAGVERPLKQPVPEGIEVCTRQSKDAEYVFIQNFNKVSTVFKPELDGAEVLFGEVTGEMKPFSTLSLIHIFAPNWHEAVAKYRKNGGTEKLKKFDYTSYDDNIPYYTMIVYENKEKIKLLLDLNDSMLEAVKRVYPQKVDVYKRQRLMS